MRALLLILLFPLVVSGIYAPLNRVQVFCEDRNSFLGALYQLERLGLGEISFDTSSRNPDVILRSMGGEIDNATLEIGETISSIYEHLDSSVNYYYFARGSLSAYDMSEGDCVGEKSIYVRQFQEAYDLAYLNLERMRGSLEKLYYLLLFMLEKDKEKADELGYDLGYFDSWLWDKFFSPTDLNRSLKRLDSLIKNFGNAPLYEFNDLLGFSRSVYVPPFLTLHSYLLKSVERIESEVFNRTRELEAQVSLCKPYYEEMQFEEAPSWANNFSKEYRNAKIALDRSKLLNFEMFENGISLAYNALISAPEINLSPVMENRKTLESELSNLTESLKTRVNVTLPEKTEGGPMANRYIYEARLHLGLSMHSDNLYKSYFHAQESEKAVVKAYASLNDPERVLRAENERFTSYVSNLSGIYPVSDILNSSLSLSKMNFEVSDIYRRYLERELYFRVYGNTLLGESAPPRPDFIPLYENISKFVSLFPETPDVAEVFEDFREISQKFEEAFPMGVLESTKTASELLSELSFNRERYFLLADYLCRNSKYLYRTYVLHYPLLANYGKITFSEKTPLGNLCSSLVKDLSIPSGLRVSSSLSVYSETSRERIGQWEVRNYSGGSGKVLIALEQCPLRAYALTNNGWEDLLVRCGEENTISGNQDVWDKFSVFLLFPPEEPNTSWQCSSESCFVEGARPYGAWLNYLPEGIGSRAYINLSAMPILARRMLNYYDLETYVHSLRIGRLVDSIVDWSRADYITNRGFQQAINYARSIVEQSLKLPQGQPEIADLAMRAFSQLSKLETLISKSEDLVEKFLSEESVFFKNLNAAFPLQPLIITEISQGINRHNDAVKYLQAYDLENAYALISSANFELERAGMSISNLTYDDVMETLGIIDSLERYQPIGFERESAFAGLLRAVSRPLTLEDAVGSYQNIFSLKVRLTDLSREYASRASQMLSNISQNYSSLRESLNLRLIGLSEVVNTYLLESGAQGMEKFRAILSDFSALPVSLSGMDPMEAYGKYILLGGIDSRANLLQKEIDGLSKKASAEKEYLLELSKELYDIYPSAEVLALYTNALNASNRAELYTSVEELFAHSQEISEKVSYRPPYELIMIAIITAGSAIAYYYVTKRSLRSEESSRSRK
jgi:hypothetical protein